MDILRSEDMVICAAATAAALLFVVWVVMRFSRGGVQKRNVPPGSMGWPLIGHTLDFIGTHSAREVEPFIKKGTSRYGKVFQANLYGIRTIVSTDTEVTKMMMQGEGKIFRSSWPRPLKKLFGKHSIIVITGEEHRRHRALFVAYMGTGRSKIASFLPHVESIALKTMSTWQEGSRIHMVDVAKHFTFNVLCKILIDLEERKVEHVHELLAAYEEGILAIPINFPGTSYYKGLQARSKLKEIIQHTINERRKNSKQGVEKSLEHGDMLDFVLLQGPDLTDEAMQDLFITAFFAGHETTTKTIASIIKLLDESPKSFKEILREHEEIRKTKQEGEGLKMEDYMQMSFTQNVINETLRMVNNSLGLFKLALEDVELKGHFIPKGSKVLASQTSIHFDPITYPNPNVFDPFRWKNLKPSQFVPFGGGIRLCPGAELARLDIAIFLHYFITRYSWEIEEKDVQIVHSPVLKITKGLPLRVTPR